MAYIKLSQYLNKHFAEGSKPTRETAIKWIESGDVVGRKLGGNWYVDPDKDPILSVTPKPTSNLSPAVQALVAQAM